MSDFMAKMHRIRFLRAPDPTGESYSVPQTPSWIKGANF